MQTRNLLKSMKGITILKTKITKTLFSASTVHSTWCKVLHKLSYWSTGIFLHKSFVRKYQNPNCVLRIIFEELRNKPYVNKKQKINF